MMELGYHLSSEEHHPDDLVRYAVRAEEAGFTYALISDHFHPWLPLQGQSPFVWGVIGAISRATRRLRLGTGVTCPTVRIHPVIAAQAAATAAAMMPSRFFFGVGSGENLNEHVVGAKWPTARVRLDLLAEAIDIIRRLWTGEQVSHRGDFFTVEEARLYTLPDEPPPLLVAGMGPEAIRLAARHGDGLITVVPEADLVSGFRDAGGAGKPTFAQLTVCWSEDEAEARETARRYFGVAGLGRLITELRTPEDFELALATMTEEAAIGGIVTDPSPDAHVRAIRDIADAGFSHVYVHQVGPDQDGFFDFYTREVMPSLS